VADPTELIAVEEWESADALRTHFGAPTVQRFVAGLGELVSRPPEVKIHAIGRTNHFPDLEGL
jgi:quinol monooxygenase YgiN